MAVSTRSSMQPLTPSEEQILFTTERVTASLSIAGILFILSTYCFSPYFNKPINRLFFFASWGNLGSCVAALISETGPAAGQTSPLCQFQGFLVQMFLGVDVLWAFCMAINVHLVFFQGYSVKQLRQLDMKYLCFCYGVSWIPAFVFIFIHTPAKQHIYGPATIWCWISQDWDFMRAAFLYGWIWLALHVAFYVYLRASIVIWKKRRHLNGFLNPLNENPFATVTTEVTITSTEVYPTKPHEPIGSPDQPPRAQLASAHPLDSEEIQPYSITIDTDPRKKSPLPNIPNIRTLTREVANEEINAEAWLYARVAILFYIALLITWVPASVNRVWTLVHPHSFKFSLNFVAALVFPLQGFWNFIVYIITSQTACRKMWDDIRMQRPRRTMNMVRLGDSNHGGNEEADDFGWSARQRLNSEGSLH